MSDQLKETDNFAESHAKDYERRVQDTATKVAEIETSIRLEAAETALRIHDKRNDANRQWQELHQGGQTSRSVGFIETAEALVNLEETSEAAIQAQKQELERYEMGMKDRQLASDLETRERAKGIQDTLVTNLSLMAQDSAKQVDSLHENLRVSESQAQASVEEVRAKERTLREKEQNAKADKIAQIRSETARKIAELERQAQEAAKKKKTSWFPPVWGRRSHDNPPPTQSHSQQNFNTSTPNSNSNQRQRGSHGKHSQAPQSSIQSSRPHSQQNAGHGRVYKPEDDLPLD